MTITYEDLLAVPYCEGGRTLAGLDCWGVCLEVFRRQGIEVPDVFAGADQLQVKLNQAGVSALDWIASLFGAWRRVPEPVVGSAVVFRDVDGNAVHVGVIVAPNRFLHASRRTGITVCRLDRPPWPDKLLGAYVYDQAS
jgi:cell wall-associated NlpC family hydrolase